MRPPRIGSSRQTIGRDYVSRMALLSILLYLIFALIGFAILYAIIRASVRAALEDHYKIVRWYERTGEWKGKKKPRDFPAT